MRMPKAGLSSFNAIKLAYLMCQDVLLFVDGCVVDACSLRGLLPPVVESITLQADRVMDQVLTALNSPPGPVFRRS